MKLVDLDPRWFAEPGRHGQGLTFLCPCAPCVSNPEKQSRIAVTFANPIDSGERLPLFSSGQGKRLTDVLVEIWGTPEAKGRDMVPPGYHWQRTGDTFEMLTLSPSVDASASGHWHGFVTGGEVR